MVELQDLILIFTTREWATIIIASVFIILIASSKRMRKPIKNLISAVCSNKIILPFIIFIAYACVIVLVLSRVSLWNWIYAKDIIIWVLFVGVPFCYNAIDWKVEKGYFVKFFPKNFKFIVISEYLINNITFSLWVEILIQIAVLFLVLIQSVAKLNKEHEPVKKLCDILLAAVGICILFFTVRKGLTVIDEFNVVDMGIKIGIPIVISLAYIPVAYLFAVIAKYELIFIRMKYYGIDDVRIQRRNESKVFMACKLSLERVVRFSEQYSKNILRTKTEDGFNAFLNEFRLGL